MILAAGTNVVVSTPGIPNFAVAPPKPPNVVVAPVAGPQGPAGPAGVRYTFAQETPAATWTIVHNLNAYPDFLFFLDSDPTVPVFTDVTYPDSNTAVVVWPSAESGRAES